MSRSYTNYKRDANGRLIPIPMERDQRGNHRPVHAQYEGGTAGTAAANWYVTSCRSCGNNNYSVESSYCSRCR